MKFHEGLFLPKPAEDTVIQFGHGPVQVLDRIGGQIFVFTTNDHSELSDFQALHDSLTEIGKNPIVIKSELPSDLAHLEWEQVMNHLVLTLMQDAGEICDQVKFAECKTYNIVT